VLEQADLGAADVPFLVGTLGKAFGSFGAFVAGDAPLIDYLMQRARSYIYTTALPPAVAATSSAALKLARQEGWRRERLAAHVARFRSGAAQLGFTLASSSTPIQPLLIGAAAEAIALSAALRAAGFWVAAIRPPTVPAGSARLRITLSAAHDESDIDALLAALDELKLPTDQGSPT
jgi:8-amino-7-oxononanoate synthase